MEARHDALEKPGYITVLPGYFHRGIEETSVHLDFFEVSKHVGVGEFLVEPDTEKWSSSIWEDEGKPVDAVEESSRDQCAEIVGGGVMI